MVSGHQGYVGDGQVLWDGFGILTERHAAYKYWFNYPGYLICTALPVTTLLEVF